MLENPSLLKGMFYNNIGNSAAKWKYFAVTLSRERGSVIVPLEIIYILHFPPGLTTPEQELLAKYFLSRILDTGAGGGGGGGVQVGQRRHDQESAPSIVYPQVYIVLYLSQSLDILLNFLYYIVRYWI